MTSIDLFFLIATVSLILITFFVCWALLYVALILKKILTTCEDFENGWNAMLQKFEEVREKISNLRAYTAIGAQSIKTLVDLFQKHLEKNSEKQSKRKKKSDDEDTDE